MLVANYTEPKQEKWDEWLATRPKAVQEVGRRLVPWKLYRDKETGLRCTIAGFSERLEGVMLIVDFTGQFNLITFGRRVHDIDPDQLEECDLPAPGEPLGYTMNAEERLDYINKARAENNLPPLTEEQLQRYSTAYNGDGPRRCAIDGDDFDHSNQVATQGEGQDQDQGEASEEEASRTERIKPPQGDI
jgi:hypothetical protein